MYDWKQTCLHLAFRFITFVMHFIFTIFFVRPQPCMLEFGREFFRWLDGESVWGWRTMPSNVHSVGLSLRRFAKIIILGENLHFSFNNLFYCLFDDWNKDPCFFVSLYSWMFPNSFILVLLDFVWYCYHQSSVIYLSILIWSLYVTFGMFLVDVNRVEQGGRCFCLELLSALLFFIVLLNCPFSFFYTQFFYVWSKYVWLFVKLKAEKH